MIVGQQIPSDAGVVGIHSHPLDPSLVSPLDAPFPLNSQTLPSMACKRCTPSSAQPPPSPPQQSSSSEESGYNTKGEEAGSPSTTAAQILPQNPEPHAPADALTDNADSSEEEEESDTESDVKASQMHPVPSSQAKVVATVAQLESNADEEEDGDSDYLEPDVP
jgi:hypothetical protein